MLGTGQAPSTLFICCHFLLFINNVFVCVCVHIYIYIRIHINTRVFAVLWLADLCVDIFLRIQCLYNVAELLAW